MDTLPAHLRPFRPCEARLEENLPSQLSGYGSTEQLSLSDLVLDDADATHSLLQTLGGMPGLQRLDLVNVYAREVSSRMPDKWPELRSLSVAFTSPPEEGHSIAPILCTMLKIPHLHNVQIEISTRSIRATGNEHRQIAQALGSQRELRTLVLSFKSKTPASATCRREPPQGMAYRPRMRRHAHAPA